MSTSKEEISRRRPRTSPKRLTALVAIAAALAVPATAGAKVIVETYNEGLQPHAVLQGHSAAVKNPTQIKVEFLSSYKAELTGRFKIKCDGSFTRSYTLTGVSPAVRTVPLSGQRGPCRVQSASARFSDPLLQGWIQVTAWGK